MLGFSNLLAWQQFSCYSEPEVQILETSYIVYLGLIICLTREGYIFRAPVGHLPAQDTAIPYRRPRRCGGAAEDPEEGQGQASDNGGQQCSYLPTMDR